MIRENLHQDNGLERTVNSYQFKIAQNKAFAFMTCGTCPVTIVGLCQLHDNKTSIMLDV